MAESQPPPTDLGSGTQFALHLSNETLTVWIHHRQLGIHETTWERLEQYEIDERVELTGTGLLIKEGSDVWYLVDRLEDVNLHGEYAPKLSQ